MPPRRFKSRMPGLLVLLLGLAPLYAHAQEAVPPAIGAGRSDAVARILSTVRAGDTASAETAEARLVSEGPSMVPAIREALASARGTDRNVLDGALVRLTWKIDPRELIVKWVAEATHRDLALVRQPNSPLPIGDEAVMRLFPNHRFYTIHFRMYPLARLTPEPLKEQNLFVVSKSGKVSHLTGAEGLKTVFATALTTPIRQPAALADAAYVWLRLTQEFSWDGFFQFTIPKESIATARAGSGWEASGKARVTPKGGDRGKIEATLAFDAAGRLTRVDETRNVQAGARPICQATKLLDPDPIVRGMAEQSLLVMGISARQYLAERRAAASPALRKAIDSIWQRILDRERALNGRLPDANTIVDRPASGN